MSWGGELSTDPVLLLGAVGGAFWGVVEGIVVRESLGGIPHNLPQKHAIESTPNGPKTTQKKEGQEKQQLVDGSPPQLDVRALNFKGLGTDGLNEQEAAKNTVRPQG